MHGQLKPGSKRLAHLVCRHEEALAVEGSCGMEF
jgi:hypothetical protein